MFLCVLRGSLVTQAGFDFTVELKMTFNFWSFGLYLLNASIIGVCHDTVFIQC